jgi:hypothetical protein
MHWCVVLFCIGASISTLEFFCVLPAFGSAGLYSWPVLRAEQVRRTGFTRIYKAVRVIASPQVVAVILAVRMVCLVALPFLPLQTPLFATAASLLLLSTFLFNWRRYIGDDGSDQMNTITIVVLVLCAGFGSGGTALGIGLAFLAFQAGLSYLAAGVAKACSTEWRDGSALFKIFNTEAYGLRPIAQLFLNHPRLGLILCWAVVVGECSFPLVVVLPLPLAACLLAMGVTFHALCAAIMGLNSFLWAFIATYPGLVFVNLLIRGHLWS